MLLVVCQTAVGQVLRSQVTVKELLLPLSGPGRAFTRPRLSTMVISSSGNDEIFPLLTVVLDTVALFSVQVWKLASGRMLPELGASAIHSALEFAQFEQLWVVLKLLAGCVESVTFSV